MAKKIFFENLNGLRFLCFLSVFLFHSFHVDFDSIKSSDLYRVVLYHIFANGNIGVNFFFVLSGFLITYLLIEEKKINGQINVLKFWIRRILRIWPLFYLCVIVGFFVFPILKSYFVHKQHNETASIGYYLTFTNNFNYIQVSAGSSILAALWSVAVEEQFYLIWPIILYVLPIKKYWVAFLSTIMISLLFRAINNNRMLNDYHTLSCVGDMAIGSLGAWLVSTNMTFKNKIQNMTTTYILVIYILFFAIFIFRDEVIDSNNFVINVMERSIIAAIILLIILEQCFSENSFFKMSKFKLLSKLGDISYGLYCLHFMGMLIVTSLTKKYSLNTTIWQFFVIDISFSLILTILLSIVSYNVFERPFLKLKNRFAFITMK